MNGIAVRLAQLARLRGRGKPFTAEIAEKIRRERGESRCEFLVSVHFGPLLSVLCGLPQRSLRLRSSPVRRRSLARRANPAARCPRPRSGVLQLLALLDHSFDQFLHLRIGGRRVHASELQALLPADARVSNDG